MSSVQVTGSVEATGTAGDIVVDHTRVGSFPVQVTGIGSGTTLVYGNCAKTIDKGKRVMVLEPIVPCGGPNGNRIALSLRLV